MGQVNKKILSKFTIKQPVFYAELNWDILLELAGRNKKEIKDLPRFPAVQRDLALVVPRRLEFETIEKTVQNIRLDKLQGLHLFDIFESEKLGADKKSLAISFTFLDEEKTLTDQEIDGWMHQLMATLEKELNAEIRKS